MAFINKEDYKDVINENILDDITQVDDDKLESCEARAIKYMKGFLSSRYDTANIFNKTGGSRDEAVLGFAKDITVYFLHRLINPRKVPANRQVAYTEAKEWLMGVSACTINPEGLPVIEGGQKDYISFGGNTKRNNQI